MMKKILLFIIVTLCGSVAVFAQNGNGIGLGVRAGISVSDITGSTGTSRVGFAGGVFVDYSISRFGLEAGLYYSEQGSSRVAEMSIEGNRADYKLDYVEVQLLAKYQLFSGFRVFAGPSSGFLVNSTMSYVQNGEKVTTPISYVRKYDVGLAGGAGYTFKFGLDVAASYTYGFSDLFVSEDKVGHTSRFKVTLGWNFLRNLNKKR